MVSHRDSVVATMWRYAYLHHKGELDGDDRAGRPPVLAKEFASNNVLTPADGTLADGVRMTIPISKRHRWFRSMTSSQALTQSVFAAVSAFGCLNVLEDVASDTGQPAFFDDGHHWDIELEHDVVGLKEPRPTNVDVLLSRTGQRVAIECKFLENEFGTCSRIGNPDPKHRCDGSYRVQNSRRHRCELTEASIRYWEYLPGLFEWSADVDHEPCPFGATYQLPRNALAATVTPDGHLDISRGHVLVVYDARNPAFQSGGKAYEQWQLVEDACKHRGLFRRLTWQRLLTALAGTPELAYLVDGLRDKYGLEPD